MMKIVEFIKTKNRYKVLNDDAKMKNPETREWQDCVIYEQYAETQDHGKTYQLFLPGLGMTFVREKQDFINKFTIVEDD